METIRSSRILNCLHANRHTWSLAKCRRHRVVHRPHSSVEPVQMIEKPQSGKHISINQFGTEIIVIICGFGFGFVGSWCGFCTTIFKSKSFLFRKFKRFHCSRSGVVFIKTTKFNWYLPNYVVCTHRNAIESNRMKQKETTLRNDCHCSDAHSLMQSPIASKRQRDEQHVRYRNASNSLDSLESRIDIFVTIRVFFFSFLLLLVSMKSKIDLACVCDKMQCCRRQI